MWPHPDPLTLTTDCKTHFSQTGHKLSQSSESFHSHLWFSLKKSSTHRVRRQTSPPAVARLSTVHTCRVFTSSQSHSPAQSGCKSPPSYISCPALWDCRTAWMPSHNIIVGGVRKPRVSLFDELGLRTKNPLFYHTAPLTPGLNELHSSQAEEH